MTKPGGEAAFVPPAAAARREARAWQNLQALRAAVVSARLNAPSLAAYVLYLHLPNQCLEEDEFTRWARSAGIRVVMHHISFWGALPKVRQRQPGAGVNTHINSGTYGRMDVPQLVTGKLAGEMRSLGIDTARVLYTDADVMFASELDLALMWPSLETACAMGTEVFSKSPNAGVMLINVSTWSHEWPRMLQFAQMHDFKFKTADQQWMSQLCRNGLILTLKGAPE